MINEFNLKQINEHSYEWADGFSLFMPKYKDGTRQINWDKVKEIILSGKYDIIEVGLAEDWDSTNAVIYEKGKVAIRANEWGFYGMSRWATPAVKLSKNGESKMYECWVLGDDEKFPNWVIVMSKDFEC